MTREKLKDTMLLAMSEHHSGNAAEAQRIVDAILTALEAAGVRMVPVEAFDEMLKCSAFVKGARDLDDYEIRAQQLVRLIENRCSRLIAAPGAPE